MACSRFEYVRHFEQHTALLRNTWIIVRIDGHAFHRFTQQHQFTKPNDSRALALMNHCATAVMDEFKDIVLAYGQSDEFSFVFHKDTTLYGRREAKIMTNVCSLFTATYVLHWPRFFDTIPLQYAPSFDSRCVCYPSVQNLRDYLSWRQADCHINNLVSVLLSCLDNY
jgi:tRNA(His) guanylyltransferase